MIDYKRFELLFLEDKVKILYDKEHYAAYPLKELIQMLWIKLRAFIDEIDMEQRINFFVKMIMMTGETDIFKLQEIVEKIEISFG